MTGKSLSETNDGATDLRAVADAAWRLRTVINLNLKRVLDAEDPILTKNIIDALNDLNEHLPLSEDGKDWQP